jgi:hypothetical protein
VGTAAPAVGTTLARLGTWDGVASVGGVKDASTARAASRAAVSTPELSLGPWVRAVMRSRG